MDTLTSGNAFGYPRLLTAPEACDRCPAPAQVSVVLRSGLDLVFCRHHAHQYRDALRRDSLYETDAGPAT